MHHRLLILGSTGSIGQSTLDVIAGLQQAGHDVQVAGLSASRSVERIVAQARHTRAPYVCLSDPSAAKQVAEELKGTPTRVLSGPKGLVELVERSDADLVIAGIVGMAGLPPVLAAAKRGLDIGLANKETLVVAGEIILSLCQQSGSRLLPVDSEHSAVFQALQAGQREDVRRIILTASGGPFRTWSADKIAHATLADALNHPTWDMGPKITIDSATMMNKALEIIEACWLFHLPPERVDVVIHPESIVHSLVEFVDAGVMAQLGTPDMRTPIQYAITYPERLNGVAERLDLTHCGPLTFEPPDENRFPALALGRLAVQRGGTAGAVLNAANEEANVAFRAGKIPFPAITEAVAAALETFCPHHSPGPVRLETILSADAETRRWVQSRM